MSDNSSSATRESAPDSIITLVLSGFGDADKALPLTYDDTMDIATIKAICAAETNQDISSMCVILDGKLLSEDGSSLRAYTVHANDVICIVHKDFVQMKRPSKLRQTSTSGTTSAAAAVNSDIVGSPSSESTTSTSSSTSSTTTTTATEAQTAAAAASASSPPPASLQKAHMLTLDDAFQFCEEMQRDKRKFSVLIERNPALAEAIKSGDIDFVFSHLNRIQQQVLNKQQQQPQHKHASRTTSSSSDRDLQRQKSGTPVSATDKEKGFKMPANQPSLTNDAGAASAGPNMRELLLLAESQRHARLDAVFEDSLAQCPELACRVTPVYITCRISRKFAVKAFIDTGSESSMLQAAACERCGLFEFVDDRWTGTASGAGEQQIIGRVHKFEIQIGTDVYNLAAGVVSRQPMELIIGLDFLTRHKCIIDLQKRQITMGDTGITVPFLPDADLPDDAKKRHSAPIAQFSNSIVTDSSRKAASAAMLQRSSHAASPSLISEADVDTLTEMGFERNDAREALDVAMLSVIQTTAGGSSTSASSEQLVESAVAVLLARTVNNTNLATNSTPASVQPQNSSSTPNPILTTESATASNKPSSEEAIVTSFKPGGAPSSGERR